MVVRQDIAPDLLLEGKPIFMNHDIDGFVTSITPRMPEELPPEIRGRFDELRHWCESL
jgi:hypothetical protein